VVESSDVLSDGLHCSGELKGGSRIILIHGNMISVDKVDYERLVHHCLCILTEVASGGSFKIIYFHSGVSGTKNRGH